MLALAPIAEDPRVAEWRAGVARLDPQACRVPGLLVRRRAPRFKPPPWPEVHAAMLAFLETLGERAAALGWSTEQVFGVHRSAGALRSDSTGALVTLYPCRVEAIDATCIHLIRGQSRQTFRGLTNPAESVPIWAFGTL